MLKDHGRYPYSSLPSRPKYEWPNGTRVAVYVAMNIEAFSFGEGKGAAIAPPDQAHSHSVYSWRDYGNRVGFWRLMDMFDELGIPAEHQLNTAVYSACPDIPARIRARKALAPPLAVEPQIVVMPKRRIAALASCPSRCRDCNRTTRRPKVPSATIIIRRLCQNARITGPGRARIASRRASWRTRHRMVALIRRTVAANNHPAINRPTGHAINVLSIC